MTQVTILIAADSLSQRMDKMKKGDIVMIHSSLAATGEDIEEGKAKLIDKYRQGDTGEWWDVEFLEEKGETYQRFIKY